jgi:hypothetical protein
MEEDTECQWLFMSIEAEIKSPLRTPYNIGVRMIWLNILGCNDSMIELSISSFKKNMLLSP